DVDERGAGAGAGDAAGGGEEGERGQDDLVAGADLQGVQGQREGVGAGAAADSVAGPTIGSDLLLEGGDLRPEDDLAAGQDARDGGLELLGELGVLGVEVAQGNPGDVGRRHGRLPSPFGTSSVRPPAGYRQRVRTVRRGQGDVKPA